jgi:MinD superfamily P-loop ATPase
MAPPLIKKVLAYADPAKLNLVDAPPGTSCPVVETMKAADFVILVTEPTPFGLHDLKLAVEASRQLNVPCGLVVNRWDLGDSQLEAYASRENLPVLLRIPFDRRIAEAYSRGEALVTRFPEWREKFLNLYDKIKRLVNGRK